MHNHSQSTAVLLQLVEQMISTQEVLGSIPNISNLYLLISKDYSFVAIFHSDRF